MPPRGRLRACPRLLAVSGSVPVLPRAFKSEGMRRTVEQKCCDVSGEVGSISPLVVAQRKEFLPV